MKTSNSNPKQSPKSTRTLSLGKETLRHLGARDLSYVAGGSYYTGAYSVVGSVVSNASRVPSGVYTVNYNYNYLTYFYG